MDSNPQVGEEEDVMTRVRLGVEASGKAPWVLVLFLCILSLTFACTPEGGQPQKTPEKVVSPSPPPAGAAEAKKEPTDLLTAISQVAEKTIPAVVHVEVTKREEVEIPSFPFGQFFGAPDAPKKFKRELKGLGTGMLMDKEGRILTNYHVVGGASEVVVLLSDGKRYPAKTVGLDPKTDLAVIQITADGQLPYVTFGDSDKVKVGQWVVAIGHPRGLDQTVTQGIISAKHRQGITEATSYQDFLQTDAAINPGNSGGPLLNLQGEVIGVNAAILSESGGYEGIGFAIPSNLALHIAGAVIAHGKVERGWLGVSIQDLTQDLAKSFGLDVPRGALIAEVNKDGPADKAGLKRGDVILAYGGKEIVDASAIRNAVADTPVGKEVALTVWRSKAKEEKTVKVGNLEDANKMMLNSLDERLGAEVAPLGKGEVEKYGLNEEKGVLIRSLDPDGPLAEAGLEEDDLILAINDVSIDGMETLINAMNSVPPQTQIRVLALDHRTNNTGYVQVTVR
jgi:serine protease Do